MVGKAVRFDLVRIMAHVPSWPVPFELNQQNEMLSAITVSSVATGHAGAGFGGRTACAVRTRLQASDRARARVVSGSVNRFS